VKIVCDNFFYSEKTISLKLMFKWLFIKKIEVAPIKSNSWDVPVTDEQQVKG